jgi:hypothetical protein
MLYCEGGGGERERVKMRGTTFNIIAGAEGEQKKVNCSESSQVLPTRSYGNGRCRAVSSSLVCTSQRTVAAALCLRPHSVPYIEDGSRSVTYTRGIICREYEH